MFSINVRKPQEVVIELCRQGCTEYWIAENAGISQGSVNKIKRGNIQNPRVDTAERLENLYLKIIGKKLGLRKM